LPSPPNDPKANVGNAVYAPDEKLYHIYKMCTFSWGAEQIWIVNSIARFKTGNEWGNSEELKGLNHLEGTTTEPSFGVE